MFIAIDEFSPAGRTSWEESVSMWQVSVWSRLCFLPAVTGTCMNLGTVYAEKCLQRLESAWRCPQGSLSPTEDHNAPSLSHTQRAWELGLSQFPWLLSSSTEQFPHRCQLSLHRQWKVRRSDQAHSFFSGTVSVVGVVLYFCWSQVKEHSGKKKMLPLFHRTSGLNWEVEKKTLTEGGWKRTRVSFSALALISQFCSITDMTRIQPSSYLRQMKTIRQKFHNRNPLKYNMLKIIICLLLVKYIQLTLQNLILWQQMMPWLDIATISSPMCCFSFLPPLSSSPPLSSLHLCHSAHKTNFGCWSFWLSICFNCVPR